MRIAAVDLNQSAAERIARTYRCVQIQQRTSESNLEDVSITVSDLTVADHLVSKASLVITAQQL